MKKTLLSLSIITALFGLNMASANTATYQTNSSTPGTASSVESTSESSSFLKQKLNELNKEYSLKYKEFMMLNQEIKKVQKELSISENIKYKEAVLKITTDMKKDISDAYAKYQPKISELETKLKEYGAKEAIYKRSQEGKEEFKEILNQLKEQKILLSEEIKKAKNILDKLKAEKEKYATATAQIPEKIKSEFSDRLNEIMSDVTSLREQITQTSIKMKEQLEKEKAEALVKKQQLQQAYEEYKQNITELNQTFANETKRLKEQTANSLKIIEADRDNKLLQLENMMKENSTELNSKTQEINNYFDEEYNEEKLKMTNTLNQVKAYHENNIKNQTFQIEQAYQNNAITKDNYEKSIKQVTESMEAIMRGELANIEAIFQKNVSEMNMMKSNALKEINNLFNAKSAEIQDKRAEALNHYNMVLAQIQENEKIDYEALKKYFSEEKVKLDQALNLLK